MKIIALIGLLLAAGAASAQQPAATPQAQLYRDESGQLRVRKVPRRAAPLAGGRERAAGRYRAEPYALRVQVPAPHPDSVAVVGPDRGSADNRMPRQPLPPVKLLPEGRKLQ